MKDRPRPEPERDATAPRPGVGKRFNPHREICGFSAPDIAGRQKRESGLSDAHKRLYERSVRWAGRNGRFWYGFETIGRELGKSSRQVKRDMHDLEKLGLIEHDRRGKRQSNMYYFLYHPMFESEVTSVSSHPRGEVTDLCGEVTSVSPGEVTSVSLESCKENYVRESSSERVGSRAAAPVTAEVQIDDDPLSYEKENPNAEAILDLMGFGMGSGDADPLMGIGPPPRKFLEAAALSLHASKCDTGFGGVDLTLYPPPDISITARIVKPWCGKGVAAFLDWVFSTMERRLGRKGRAEGVFVYGLFLTDSERCARAWEPGRLVSRKLSEQVTGMKIEMWDIDRPKDYPQNARKWGTRAIAKVGASIKAFGWRQPIVVDKHEVIVIGHLRRSAGRGIGETQCPVHVAHDLTAAQIRGLRLADNRTNEESDWDIELLAAEFGELQALDFDLTLTGFDSREIDSFTITPNAAEDEVPPVPEVPTSRPGDVWLCGQHRVLCGDATSETDVARLLDGRKPFLMVTDPPYGISLDSEWRDRAGLNGHGPAEPSYLKHRTAGHTATTISGDTRADWSGAFELIPSLQIAYVWHASAYTTEVLSGLLRLGFLYPQQIIWDKTRTVLTRTHYWFEHEPCWYVRKKKAPWFGKPGENSTIWRCASPKFIMGGSKDPADVKQDHCTQKPVELARRPILNHTKRGELVYEPFLGSGTTLAAAELTERVCYGLELDPKYVDVDVLRWQALSGQQATLEGDGRTFAEIKTERIRVAA